MQSTQKNRAVRVGVVLAGSMLWLAAAPAARADAPARPVAPPEPAHVGAARARLAEAPRDADRALALGVALRRAGRPDEAIRALGTASALGAGREVGRLAVWETARSWVDKHEYNRAIAICRGLERGAHGVAFSHVCIAEVQLGPRRAGEALAEIALGKIDGAPAIVKLRAKIVAGLARELELKDDLAETELREGAAMDPSSADAAFALGRLLARVHKTGEAELRRAAQAEPDDALILVELARALGPTDEAKALLERAAAARPSDPAAHRQLAELHLAKGRLPDAKRAAETALAIDARDVISHVVHGKVLLAEGQWAAARKSGEAALAVQPNSAPAKLVVADAYAAEGEIDLAIEAYQAAYGLDHGSPDPLLRASKACLAARRATSARAFALRATQDFADWAPAWETFGDALDKDGEHGAAAEAFGKALAAAKGAIDRDAVGQKQRRATQSAASRGPAP